MVKRIAPPPFNKRARGDSGLTRTLLLTRRRRRIGSHDECACSIHRGLLLDRVPTQF